MFLLWTNLKKYEQRKNPNNNSNVNDYNDDNGKNNTCCNCACGNKIMKHNLSEHTCRWKYDQIRTAEIKHDITFITLHLDRQYWSEKNNPMFSHLLCCLFLDHSLFYFNNNNYYYYNYNYNYYYYYYYYYYNNNNNNNNNNNINIKKNNNMASFVLKVNITSLSTNRKVSQTWAPTRSYLGRKEMFYLTTHSTHFIYGYMASDIW